MWENASVPPSASLPPYSSLPSSLSLEHSALNACDDGVFLVQNDTCLFANTKLLKLLNLEHSTLFYSPVSLHSFLSLFLSQREVENFLLLSRSSLQQKKEKEMCLLLPSRIHVSVSFLPSSASSFACVFKSTTSTSEKFEKLRLLEVSAPFICIHSFCLQSLFLHFPPTCLS